jgi:hypothetical protein
MAGEDGKMNWTMKICYVLLISIVTSYTAVYAQESRLLYDDKVAEICRWIDVI